eukprot:CAMPEP_0118916938 /NCGR_PEP_ID=MMETSP1166-20130328/16849_1 /TAXON_ID=1104430 /ORGANISM="Chrysoreinhardia sp, Strain CCMP3193" /LENGTH=42 /DNA_ID= /DNA_START= /DNA_END= /DNA_ORIENTATION=
MKWELGKVTQSKKNKHSNYEVLFNDSGRRNMLLQLDRYYEDA